MTCCTRAWYHGVAFPTNAFTDATVSPPLCLHVPRVGPWAGLSGATLPGPSPYPRAQPLRWPRATSRHPDTGPQRRVRHRSAPGCPGAAAVALGPPSPPSGRVLSPRMPPATLTRAVRAIQSVGQLFRARQGFPARHARIARECEERRGIGCSDAGNMCMLARTFRLGEPTSPLHVPVLVARAASSTVTVSTVPSRLSACVSSGSR